VARRFEEWVVANASRDDGDFVGRQRDLKRRGVGASLIESAQAGGADLAEQLREGGLEGGKLFMVQRGARALVRIARHAQTGITFRARGGDGVAERVGLSYGIESVQAGPGGIGEHQGGAFAELQHGLIPGFEIGEHGGEARRWPPVHATFSAQETVVNESGDCGVLLFFFCVRKADVTARLQ
jgi:hypothetical protein